MPTQIGELLVKENFITADQLEIALKTQELNFFDASRLEARLAQLKREKDESETGDRK